MKKSKRILLLALVTVLILSMLPTCIFAMVIESVRLLVEPQLVAHSIYYYPDDLFMIIYDGKCGYVNSSLQEIVKPKYNWASSFSEGLAAVKINDKWGYINTEGQEVIALQYDWAGDFSEGLAAVSINDKYGYINTEGQEVIALQYDWAGDFSEGLAVVNIDDKWGYINTEGQEAIALQYDWAGDFSEGLAAVYKNGKWGYIDREGREVLALRYDYANSFSEGLAAVCKDYKWGYINTEGREVVEPQYDYAETFYGGRAIVRLGDKWGVVGINDIGELWAVGENSKGQLGLGTTEDCDKPVKVMDNVIKVVAGRGAAYQASYAIKEDGTLWAWGHKDSLGPDEYETTYKPIKVLENVKDVEVGYHTVAAILQDSTLLVWGTMTKGLFAFGVHNIGLDTNVKKVAFDDALVTPNLFYIKEDGTLWVSENSLSGFAKPKQLDTNACSISGNKNVIYKKNDGTLWAAFTDSTRKLFDNVLVDSNPRYIYDTKDPGETVVLPYKDLEKVTDKAGAIKAITDVARDMTEAQKESSTGVDLITLYAEHAIAQAASAEVSGSSINVNSETVGALQSSALDVKEAAQTALVSSGITPHRELSCGVKFKTDDADEVTITIDKTALETVVDNVRVESPSFAVTINPSALKQDIGDDPLVITVSEVSSITASNGSEYLLASSSPKLIASSSTKTYQVSFNKGTLTENITVSLPKASGDAKYQAVLKQDGTPVGGKYNPATNAIDVKIRESGTYTVKENKKDFTDIQTKSNEMQEAIRVLASKGIISGTSATTFSPDSPISRAEIAALIVRTLSKLDPNADGGFSDVSRNDWYFGVAGSSKKYNIVKGYDDNTFRGGTTITKDQIVAVSARTLRAEMKYSDPVDIEMYLSGYTDRSSIPDWALADISLATRENLVLKRTDGTFLPASNMTRGDAAIILKRLFNRIW